MIVWKVVVNDFGDCVSVTEINWPNKKYFSRIVEQFAGLMVVKEKKKKN